MVVSSATRRGSDGRDRDARHQAGSGPTRPPARARSSGSGAGSRRRARGGHRCRGGGPNGARSAPSSVTIAVISSAGVTSKAGFRTVGSRRRDQRLAAERSRTSAAGTLLDRDGRAVGGDRGRPTLSGAQTTNGMPWRAARTASVYVPTCSRCRRSRRPGPPPTRITSTSPPAISGPAAMSAMSSVRDAGLRRAPRRVSRAP